MIKATARIATIGGYDSTHWAAYVDYVVHDGTTTAAQASVAVNAIPAGILQSTLDSAIKTAVKNDSAAQFGITWNLLDDVDLL